MFESWNIGQILHFYKNILILFSKKHGDVMTTVQGLQVMHYRNLGKIEKFLL